jgi:hypothetical protein
MSIRISAVGNRTGAIFVMCHVDPIYQIPANWNVVWAGNRPIPETLFAHNVLALSDVSPRLNSLHPVFNGSCGPFFLLEMHKELVSFDFVGIVQYRKVIANRGIGVPAKGLPGTMICEVGPLNIALPQICWPISGNLLVPRPTNVGSVLSQFASVHPVEDLLRYVAIAVEQGVLSGREVSAFMNSPQIFPGGLEFGIFPPGFLFGMLKEVRGVAERYLEKDARQREGYNARAISFCGERLGSYLLMRKLYKTFGAQPPKDIFGYMVTVGPGDMYVPGV